MGLETILIIVGLVLGNASDPGLSEAGHTCLTIGLYLLAIEVVISICVLILFWWQGRTRRRGW